MPVQQMDNMSNNMQMPPQQQDFKMAEVSFVYHFVGVCFENESHFSLESQSTLQSQRYDATTTATAGSTTTPE